MHNMSRISGWILFTGLVVACGGGGGGGSGGGGGGGGTSDPPATIPDPPYLPGLTALAAGPGSARVDWFLPGAGFEAALFQGTTPNNVFAGGPVATGLTGTGTVRTGLANGADVFFGLGVRPTGGGAYTQAGEILLARPGGRIYVDAAASAGGADGTSPGTAFPTLAEALVAVGVSGNIWVRDGNYAAPALRVPGGVHIYGGFTAAFDLATRDAQSGATVLQGQAGLAAVEVRDEGPSAILDGLVLDGRGLGFIGLDDNDTDLELRSVTVTDFRDRGLRIRSILIDQEVDVTLVSCSVTNNGGDGVSIVGAFDLRIDGSNFDANRQEGVDCDDLVALAGGRASLIVRGSRFFGNGAQGLDADLAAPLGGGSGSEFDIDIRGCRFERNDGDGLLLDMETDNFPTWVTSIRVRECIARANANAGIHIDFDGVGDALIHRVTSNANGTDGFLISSEARAGIVPISASLAMGNLGAGLRATNGNQAILATHCVLAGNLAGGVISPAAESMATSSVAWLQPNPWQSTTTNAVVEVTDPLTATFNEVPEVFQRVQSMAGADLTLQGAAAFAPGTPVELADDGVGTTAATVSGTSVSLAAAPLDFVPPGMLFAFAPGDGPVEDFGLVTGSPAEDAGMTPPGGAIVDAGILGAPSAAAPSLFDTVPEGLFYPESATPAPDSALGSNQSIAIVFSSPIQAGSVVSDQVRAVVDGGAVLTVGLSTAGSTLTVSPPGGGWGGTPFRLELHADLAATSGVTLTTPLSLRFRP